MKIPTGCTKPPSSHVKIKPVSNGNGTEMQWIVMTLLLLWT